MPKGKPAAVYAAPALRWNDQYLVVSGLLPEVRWIFHPNKLVRDHVWWRLKLEMKYQRWPWWQLKPPPMVWRMDFVDYERGSRPLAWMLTLWTISKMLGAGR